MLMTEITTPELDKMTEVREESQAIGEFLEWFFTKYDPCIFDEDEETYYPAFINIQPLLAEYFDIDLDKVEEERSAILADLRRHNGSE